MKRQRYSPISLHTDCMCEWVNGHFPEQWMERGRWKTWPQWSPDLTLLDFSFGGNVKQVVYMVNINELDHVKQKIKRCSSVYSPRCSDLAATKTGIPTRWIQRDRWSLHWTSSYTSKEWPFVFYFMFVSFSLCTVSRNREALALHHT